MKNNIKNRLVCLVMAAAMAACALTACGDPVDNTSSTQWTPHRFGMEDLTANGVKLGMSVEEVKDILGKPDKEENITENQFIYGKHLDLTYGKMTLSFYDIQEGENNTLSSISSDSSEDLFAGGIHVGSTKEEVLATFAQDKNAPDLILYGEKYGSFVYGDMTSDDFIEKKPTGAVENAYIQDRDAQADGYYLIIYNYYNPLKWSDDGSSFTGDYYHMIFYVDSQKNTVNSILLEHQLAM